MTLNVDKFWKENTLPKGLAFDNDFLSHGSSSEWVHIISYEDGGDNIPKPGHMEINNLDLRFGARNARAAELNLTSDTTLVNLTGKGYLLWVAGQGGTNNSAPRLNIWVDGAFDYMSGANKDALATGAVAQDNNGPPIVMVNGHIDVTTMNDNQKEYIRGLCVLGIRFENSLKIDVRHDPDSSSTKAACLYVFDSELE